MGTGFFTGNKASGACFDLHFMPRLRMGGAIVYSPYMFYGAERNNITFIIFMFAYVHFVAIIVLSSMCYGARLVGQELHSG
jgi:hypothetical protein